MSPITMPLWNGTGKESVFTAAVKFCKRARNDDMAVLGESVRAWKRLKGSWGDDEANSLNQAFQAVAGHSLVTNRNHLTHTEGTAFTSHPPRRYAASKVNTVYPEGIHVSSLTLQLPRHARRLANIQDTVAIEPPRRHVRSASSPNLPHATRCTEFYH